MPADFRYHRSDFGPLPVRLEHMDISLVFLDDRVEGTNVLRFTAREPLDHLLLDARDLAVHEVRQIGADGSATDAAYDVLPDEHKLRVTLAEPVRPGDGFTIRTRTTCVPSDNVLEGIYKDTTPPGCPQQYISQCEQWGFQRILPVIDDCRAKCTMTVALEADARYTHLLSNGNVNPRANPGGKPAPKPHDPSRLVIAYDNPIPMAPYLFFVGVGTWDILEDEVVYPSGKRVKLEYLVPPGRLAGAELPMQILKDSILWQGRTQEYEYPYDVYRTICMEKSNWGGMENTGNTTIITDAALVDEFTGDRRLKYAYGVIVHEFEHNQCGSEVTMETPFDMWLNEAFTVDVERRFSCTQFDPDVTRLEEVDAMRAPLSGPLAVEDGGHLGNIVREGFNDPDELVDGVTYVKAAEVIRMLRLVLGEEAFRRAKNLYFSRHHGGNANTDQFFACFEEAGGRDLAQFRQEWLHTIGYPRLCAAHAYDAAARALTITLTQERHGSGGPFHVPVELAAVDAAGHDIPATARIVELTGDRAEFSFRDVPEPAFVSYNRNCSFYGSFRDTTSGRESLLAQIRYDPNGFNRVEAMRRLTDMERVRLIHDPAAPVGEGWLDAYGSIVADMSLPPGLKAYLLQIDEQSLAREFLPCYRERYAARLRLLGEAAERHRDALVRTFHGIDTYAPAREPRDGVEERGLKAVLLRTLMECRSRPMHALAEEHFRRAWNITDKASALSCIQVSDHPERLALLEEARRLWQDHLSAYLTYLGTIGGSIHDDVFELMAREERRPGFSLEHPGHCRALFLPFTANNKMLWTARGIDWIAQTVCRLAPVNDNTALRLLACFRLVDRLADDLRPAVTAALEAVVRGVDSAAAPATAGRARAFLP